MKKLIVSIVFASAILSVTVEAKTPKKEAVKAFLDSKTKVVLEEANISYNAEIKKAVEKYWEITDYEFISYDEFKEQMDNPDLSFLITTQTRFDKDKKPVEYTFLNLVMGKTGATLTSMPELVSLPISYADEHEVDHYYVLPVMIRFFQNHIQNLQEHRFGIALRKLKYYHKNLPDIRKKKELWLEKASLAPSVDKAAEIEDIYAHDYEIVERSQIEKAIQEQKEDVVFLHKVGPRNEKGWIGRCYKMIFGTENGKLYFYKYHTISDKHPDGFLPKDFKRLKRFSLF